MPIIHGLTVSVGYGEQLRASLPLWLIGCQSVMVVTDQHDTETARTCQETEKVLRYHSYTPNLSLYKTDAFTLDGAPFNKGRAMEDARRHIPWQDWILFFDADIVPEPGWSAKLQDLQMGYLYGAKRREARDYGGVFDPLCPYVADDRVGYGYFQLFHAKDPKVQKTPLLDTHWRHAGNYDSNFLLSFRSMVRELPVELWHLGEQSRNWYGVGGEEQYQEMMKRRSGHGIHPSESLLNHQLNRKV